MDLLRFDDITQGPIYVDSRALFVLLNDGLGCTSIAVTTGRTTETITVGGDVDELTQTMERVVPGLRIHRIT